MKVAITMRLAPEVRYDEPRDAISHDWIEYLQQFSVEPLLVPNALNDPLAFILGCGAQRLLLTGGNSAQEGSIRDRTETALLTGALDKAIPVLGVCRGLQMINAHFGGAICRDLATHVPAESHVACAHAVHLEDGSTASVNSYHDEGVLQSGLASALIPTAWSDGGVVEAVRHPTEAVAAIQWHPERDDPSPGLNQAIIEKWLHP